MPAIVLLTDFGDQDFFVGVVKGVIANINPMARVIDLTHQIEPQNVSQAAFVLWASHKFFPDDGIFVSIVDPGVGTSRKIICGRIDGRIFVAPENGLLDYVVADAEDYEFYEVNSPEHFLPNVSTTFHGRDIFAPVAAHLSRGLRLNDLGGKFSYPKVERFYSSIRNGRNTGKVVYIDRFGNIFTSLLWNDTLLTGKSALTIGSRHITRYYHSYSESPGHAPVGIKGSSSLLEIAVNQGSAARILKARIGDKVTLLNRGSDNG